MATSSTAQEYNRTSFTLDAPQRGQDRASQDFHPALHVGMPAPDFAVTDLEGNTVRLSDFTGHKHVLFEFGCITAPVFVGDVTTLNRLHAQFHDEDVQVLVVYVREAHPGDRYSFHTSYEQKVSHARDLKRLEKVQCPVLVDSLEGDAHHLYGLRASPVYIANKDGLLTYKAGWLVPEEAELALSQLVRAEQVQAGGGRTRNVYSELLTPLVADYTGHARVFARAGKGAREDVTRAFGRDVAAVPQQRA